MHSQHGRSMVETLGVLAIVGVLSVGGIADYSKAMMKYKLNKQAESFNTFLNNMIQIQPSLAQSLSSISNMREFSYKAHLIPDGMYYNDEKNEIYDIFHNRVHPMYYSTKTYTEFVIEYAMEISGTFATSHSIEICRNLVNTAKENAEYLYWIELRNAKDQGTANYDKTRIYGYNLRKFGITEIDNFCSSCNSEHACRILFYIYYERHGQ